MSVESVKGRSSRSVFKLFVQLLLPMNFLTLWPRKKKINSIFKDSDFLSSLIDINMYRIVYKDVTLCLFLSVLLISSIILL